MNMIKLILAISIILFVHRSATGAENDQGNIAKGKSVYGLGKNLAKWTDGDPLTSAAPDKDYYSITILDLGGVYKLSKINVFGAKIDNITFSLSTWDKPTSICQMESFHPWNLCQSNLKFDQKNQRLQLNCTTKSMTAQYIIITVGELNGLTMVNGPLIAEIEVYGTFRKETLQPPSFENDPNPNNDYWTLRESILGGQDKVFVDAYASEIFINNQYDDLALWWVNNWIYASLARRGKARLLVLGGYKMADNILNDTGYTGLRKNLFAWLTNNATTYKVVKPTDSIQAGDILDIRRTQIFDVNDIYQRISSGKNPAILSKPAWPVLVTPIDFTTLVERLQIEFNPSLTVYKYNEVNLSTTKNDVNSLNLIRKLKMYKASWSVMNSTLISNNFNDMDATLFEMIKSAEYQSVIRSILSRYKPYFDFYVPCGRKTVNLTDDVRTAWLNYNLFLMAQTGTSMIMAAGVGLHTGYVRQGVKPTTFSNAIKTDVAKDFIPTGAYANPGELFTWEVTDGLWPVKMTARIRIGCQTDYLPNHNPYIRWPRVSHRIPFTMKGQYGSAFGGLIYVEFSVPINITIKWSTVYRSPWFDIRNPKSIENWNEERIKYSGVPRMHIIGDAMHACLPVLDVIQYTKEQLNSSVHFHDKSVKTVRTYRGLDWNVSKTEMMSTDVQISLGWGHSGYPFMGYLPWSNYYLNANEYLTASDSGIIHEVGHNLQPSACTLINGVEVTNNIFIPLIKKRLTNIQYYTMGVGYWLSNNSLTNTVTQWKSQKWSGVTITYYGYISYYFSDGLIGNVFDKYEREQIKPSTDDEKASRWVLELSREAGYNLIPLHELWSFPQVDTNASDVKQLPCFLPQDYVTDQAADLITSILNKYGKTCQRTRPNNIAYKRDITAGWEVHRPPFVFVQ